eukprot:2451707-Amphidinium_carterae.1
MVAFWQEGGRSCSEQASSALSTDRRCDLFIGKLAESVTREVLIEFFNENGFPVVDYLVKVPMAQGAPRGYAFVTLKHPLNSEKAIRQLTGKPLHGRRITVERSTDPVPSVTAPPGIKPSEWFDAPGDADIRSVHERLKQRPTSLVIEGLEKDVRTSEIVKAVVTLPITPEPSKRDVKAVKIHRAEEQGTK